MSWHHGKLGFTHAFQLCTYSLRFFYDGGDAKRPPQAIHIFRSPPFIGLKNYPSLFKYTDDAYRMVPEQKNMVVEG